MPDLVTDDGTRLHYTDTGGSGRPLVLVHGWPLSGEAFAGNVPAFRDAGYRVVTYDRRGFGDSDKPAAGYDYDTLSADLAAVLETLDLTGAAVLGFSMGGGELARSFGAGRAGRIAAAVFSGSITPALCVTDDNPDGAMPRDGFDQMAAQCRADHAGFLDQFTGWFFSTEAGGLQVDEATRQEALRIGLRSDPEAAARCIEIWATDLRADCGAIDVPTLVIHGTGDINVPAAASSARMAGYVPDSRLELIDGAPHGANVSHASQWERLVLDFLAALP